MCSLADLEEIKSILDLGEAVKIITADNTHTIPKLALNFRMSGELMVPLLQNHGANIIRFTSWSQIQRLMRENNVTLPDEVSPCPTCKGSECRFCSRD